MNLDDLYFIFSGARTFVGEAKFKIREGRLLGSDTHLTMSPIYDMSVTASEAGGNLQIRRTVFPVLLYSGISRLDFPVDTPYVKVRDVLTLSEIEDLKRAIESAEKMQRAIYEVEVGKSKELEAQMKLALERN